MRKALVELELSTYIIQDNRDIGDIGAGSDLDFEAVEILKRMEDSR